jgi:hypothetical protein
MPETMEIGNTVRVFFVAAALCSQMVAQRWRARMDFFLDQFQRSFKILRLWSGVVVNEIVSQFGWSSFERIPTIQNNRS